MTNGHPRLTVPPASDVREEVVAESVVMVCDVCGAPADEGVIIRSGGRNYAKDLCAKHLKELLAGSRTPKRGRRPGSVSKDPAKRQRAATAKSSKTARRSGTRRKTARAGRRKAVSTA